MNEQFIVYIEMVVYKMVEEGKLKIQKTINSENEYYLSLNCILKEDEPDDNGQIPIYIANRNGENGVKIGDVDSL